MAKAHIFISYAHEDKEWVLEGPGNIHLIPRIRRHTSPDAEIWFDEGLVIGEKWDEEIHNHIVQQRTRLDQRASRKKRYENRSSTHRKHHRKIETNNRLDISKANTPFRDTTALQLSQR